MPTLTTAPAKPSGTFRLCDDIEMYLLFLLIESDEAEPGVPLNTAVIEEAVRTKLGSPCIDRIMRLCEAGYVGETENHRSVAVLPAGRDCFRREQAAWVKRLKGRRVEGKTEPVYGYDTDSLCVLNPQGREYLLAQFAPTADAAGPGGPAASGQGSSHKGGDGSASGGRPTTPRR